MAMSCNFINVPICNAARGQAQADRAYDVQVRTQMRTQPCCRQSISAQFHAPFLRPRLRPLGLV